MPYWRLSSFYFFYFALLGAWMPYWPLFLADEGFSAMDIGYLVGIMMGTKIVAPNIWGWLAERSGQRMAIIRFGAALAFLLFLGVFIDRRFWSLALIIFLFSFFWNAILAQFEVVTLSQLRQYFSHYSRIRLWGSIGFILSVIGLGWVFDHLATRWLPWFIAAMLLALWLSSLTVSEKRRSGHEDSQPRFWPEVLTDRSAQAFFLTCFLLQLSHGPYYTFFSVYLVDNGYSRASTGLFWSLGVVAEVLIFLVMHRLMQRLSLFLLLQLSLLLTALRWLMIGLWVDQIALLVLAQLLHAASFASYHAVAIEYIRRRFSDRAQGQGMALYSGLSYGAGGAAGAVVSGWLWEWSPAGCFLLAAAVAVLALLVGRRIRFERTVSDTASIHSL